MANPLSYCLASQVSQGVVGRGSDKIIKETARSIEERYPIEMEALGKDRNHIHVLCAAHPQIAPGRIVQRIKSVTAREIFRRQLVLRRDLWGVEFWSAGYYAATVGERANWRRTLCPTPKSPQRSPPTA